MGPPTRLINHSSTTFMAFNLVNVPRPLSQSTQPLKTKRFIQCHTVCSLSWVWRYFFCKYFSCKRRNISIIWEKKSSTSFFFTQGTHLQDNFLGIVINPSLSEFVWQVDGTRKKGKDLVTRGGLMRIQRWKKEIGNCLFLCEINCLVNQNKVNFESRTILVRVWKRHLKEHLSSKEKVITFLLPFAMENNRNNTLAP